MTFPNSNESGTQPKYKYRFESKLKSFDLDIPPENWAENGFGISRSLKSGGMTSMLSLDKFVFVAEAAEHLKELYRLDFVGAKCTMREYEFINSTYTYRENPTSYELDFETYKVIKIDGYAFAVSIQGGKSSTVLTFANRKETKVDINNLKSIGNYTIVDFADLKTLLWFDPITAISQGAFSGGSYPIGTSSWLTVDVNEITTTDFDELQVVIGGLSQSKENSFFFESEKDRTINISGQIGVNVTQLTIASTTINANVHIYDLSGVYVSNKTLSPTITVTTEDNYYINLDDSFDLLTGESASLVIAFTSTIDPLDAAVTTTSSLTISSVNTEVSENLVESWPLLEASMRVCQKVFDKQYAYYSDKFGRTGVVYNYDGDAYLSENQLAFANLCTGLDLRYVDYNDTNNPHSMSFDELFDTKQVLFNTGYGIEIIDGVEMIREEDYSYFFNNTVILDFSDDINPLDIEEEVLSEECFAEIKYGFKKFSNETKYGRGEYNTNANRTTILNTKKTFESIAPFRADTTGIAMALSSRANIAGSTDQKSDNEIFIVKTQVSEFAPTIDWKAETDENITVLNDSSGFQEGGLNYYFTPLRSLIRRASRFTGGLFRALSSELLWQTSSINQSLETSGEGYSVKENADIPVASTYLDAPLFLPIVNTVEVEFTSEHKEILNAIGADGIPNMYKIIKFSDDVQGWLYPNIKKKNGEIKAIVKIIRQNI